METNEYERHVRDVFKAEEEHQRAVARLRQMQESLNYSVLYEDYFIIVRKNSSGEIFIVNKKDGKTTRTSVYNGQLVTTASNGILTPVSRNGVGGFAVV